MSFHRLELLAAVSMALAAGPARAADKVRAAIGQRGNWDTLVTSQGIERGLFQKENLEVEITWTRGGAETLQAVITGSADLALANGIAGVIGVYAKGAPVRIVSAETTGAADLFWYVKAESPVKTMKDMDGKTMGYSRPGSSSFLVAMALAEEARVKPRLVSSGDAAGTRVQVMSGQIDCGWSVPPFGLDLVKEGKVRIIARGGDAPSLARQSVRVNVASLPFLRERRDVARRFMKAYAATIDWMYQDAEASTAFYARFNGIPLEVAKETLAFFPKASLALEVSGLDLSLAQALEYKNIDKPMSPEEAKGLVDMVYPPAP